MITAQEARLKWLTSRNPDLVHECIWRLKRLIELEDLILKESLYTEKFDITFNNNHELVVFQKYLKLSGFALNISSTVFQEKLQYNIEIGI